MRYCIFDIESDGLLNTITKIHCMSVKRVIDGVEEYFTLTDYSKMREFITSEPILIGHNIILYDIPAIKKVLGISPNRNTELIDTLALSWYLYPKYEEHGLEVWGERLGIKKPTIIDWQNQKIEDYIYRCEQDVLINSRLFSEQIGYLKAIYYNDGQNMDRLIRYLSYKMDCAREQEEVMCKIDLKKAKENLLFLEEEYDRKERALAAQMPNPTFIKKHTYPAKPYKKDGTLSSTGKKWVALCRDMGLPEDNTETILEEVEKGEPPNGGSVPQIKSFLFSIGWVPETFKIEKDKKNPDAAPRKIPQISLLDSPDLCPSVKALFESYPVLENLEGMFMARHRKNILKNFIEQSNEQGYIKAQVLGFTNTLRFRHTNPMVNLPSIHKPYGKEIRGCIIAPGEEYELCGSDMSSLEDNTKHHYIYPYDPEYVKEMRTPIFDPHIDIGVQSKLVSKAEADFYRWMDGKPIPEEWILPDYLQMTPEEQKVAFKKISKPRGIAKRGNFACTYGAGPAKISESCKIAFEVAKTVHTAYWERNWAIKQMAADTPHKTLGGQMWVYNPVSKFWYSLRYEKDKFSTVNQSTGAYCFDTWTRNVRNKGIRISAQFHDEILFSFLKVYREQVKKHLKDAIRETNEQLKLNVELGISIEFGDSYATVH